MLKCAPRSGSGCYVPTRYQKTALHIAAECSTADVVAALLKAGAHVNPEDNHKKTPLHKACSRFDYDAGPALLLIRNGAAVNAICGTDFRTRPWTSQLAHGSTAASSRSSSAPARPPRAHTDQLLLQGVHPESDHGGRLRRLPAHPPQRPRRNVRPAFRPPPPAGDGPSSSSTPSTSVTTE